MANDILITLLGNLTGDPELRYTQNGAAVANFTIASTPRSFDKNANDWKDGETTFMRCSVWREHAEHVAASLFKGTAVIAYGMLKSRSYDTKEGEKRTSMELEIEAIGPQLRNATVVVTKAQSSATQSRNQQSRGGQTQQRQAPQPEPGYGNYDPSEETPF